MTCPNCAALTAELERLRNADDSTAKRCTLCSGPLVSLRGQGARICNDCKTEFEWLLDDGQRPLLGSNRGDRK